MKRTLWKADGKLASSAAVGDYGPNISPADENEATLVGSATGVITRDGPLHAPAIDIDIPCELVESSSKGHFHLYINTEITTRQYDAILLALSKAGIVQDGFYRSFVQRGQTFLRRPGVKKCDT